MRKGLPLAPAFAPAFAALRIRAGLTQGELARRCGVSRATVSKWESGSAPPSLRALAVLRAVPSLSDADVGELIATAWQADATLPRRRRRRTASARRSVA